MQIGRKVKAIRLNEGFNQDKFSNLIDIPVDSLRSYEIGRRKIGEENMVKIAMNKKLKKYAYWLITDEVLPESGQISPDFSILLQLGLVEDEVKLDKRA